MIPDFVDNGYLPAGVFHATIEEVEGRFGRQSEIRAAQVESLRWLLDLARQAGVRRIVVNGSFVTDTLEPNDVDCALLLGADYPTDQAAADELLEGLPFLSLNFVREADFDFLTRDFFATDRWHVPKGMIEIV